jgi:hypothetical protein
MKEWKTYTFKVNGFVQESRFDAEAVDNIFLPLLERWEDMYCHEGRRIIVFVAAPPATGKSTLMAFWEYLAAERKSNISFKSLGLDGFHYHSSYINGHSVTIDGVTRQMREVKGCPETFDTAHFNDKLNELKDCKKVLWPVYDRNIHDVIEDALEVDSDIVVIEGNWLLLDEEPWRRFAKIADDTVFIKADENVLKSRLIARKEKGGLSHEEAVKWYISSDGVNVRRVLEHSMTGRVNLKLDEDGGYST